MNKPFSQACDNNKGPVLAVLLSAFSDVKHVLEIGSGTGQHAVYFAKALPQLVWQASDREENISGINAWIDDEPSSNLRPPVTLDVTHLPWPVKQTDGIFSANTAHIMAWSEVEAMFGQIGKILRDNGIMCLYGPFNYGGTYTSQSNERFDQWLKQQNPHQAIRHFEDIEALANRAGMSLARDHEMPANNRLLQFSKNL